MKNNQQKIQMTVRLSPGVYRAAKEVERRRKIPISVIVADAAAEVLVPPAHESPEVRMQNLSNRMLGRMETLERALGRELYSTKELVAQLTRAFFNHTPAIPDSERASASLSGRIRFVRLVEQVNLNVKDGLSILNDSEVNHGG